MSIKIFRCIIIVTITAGICLTACGSRDGKEVEQENQAEPESENDSDSWAQAYISVIDELREDWELDEIDFSLIYINDDDIPELVFGPEGYWVSVYTWQDGQVSPLIALIDKWGYGNWGRVQCLWSCGRKRVLL